MLHLANKSVCKVICVGRFHLRGFATAPTDQVDLTKVPVENGMRYSEQLDQEKEAHEIVLERISNIVKNVLEDQTSKVLHIYPESKDIIGLLGRVWLLKMTIS